MDDLLKTPITIKVESPVPEGKVSAREFVFALQEIIAIAEDIERSITGESSGGWVISDLGLGSAIAAIAPPSTDARPAYYFANALVAIQAGSETIPEYISYESLERIKKISNRKNAHTTISHEQITIPLNKTINAKIDEWLSIYYESIGSVEGRIEVVSLRKGLHFSIYDDRNRRIECAFPQTMLSDVKHALGERVAIRGMIRYRANGRPISIRPTQLYQYPSDEANPPMSINKLIGIIDLPMSAVDYIRQGRAQHE